MGRQHDLPPRNPQAKKRGASSALTSGLIGGLANLGWNLANGVGLNDAADRVFATGKDPLNISGLPGGFDWRKGVHDKMIASAHAHRSWQHRKIFHAAT